MGGKGKGWGRGEGLGAFRKWGGGDCEDNGGGGRGIQEDKGGMEIGRRIVKRGEAKDLEDSRRGRGKEERDRKWKGKQKREKGKNNKYRKKVITHGG